MFLQSCRWKWKETSTKGFFKLSKKNLRHRCFHSLATFCKGFLGENKGTINIAECWCEIDCTSEDSVIKQSWIAFSQMFPNFQMVHGQLAMSLRRMKTSVICKCQFFDIQQWSVLSTTFSVTEISPRRDSAKRQLPRLHSQFSFTKMLKAPQVLTFTAIWRNVPKPS